MALVFLFLLGNSVMSFAAATTPMELFIQRAMQSGSFTKVDNIWQPDLQFDQTDLLKKVSKAQPLTIDYSHLSAFMTAQNRSIQLILPNANGGTYTVDLSRYDFLTDGFKVEAVGEQGSSFPAYTPGLYYRGTVDGIAGSVAAFSFFNNEVYGVFSIPGEGNYVLVPNTMVGTYYGYNQHYLLYNDKDMLIKDKAPGCGTDDLPVQNRSLAKTTTTENNDVYASCKEIRVYEFADYSTYASKSHSVTNVTNYLTALFNNQSTLYRNETILVALQYIKIDTVTDTYQSIPDNSLPWLTHFSYNTQTNMNGSDVAVMMATKYGDMGGVAWLQTLGYGYYAQDSAGPYAFCDIDNSAVVNFPTFSWDVEVTTHEMGHVLGSPHTHRCCWNPPGTGTTAIDGCYTLEGSCSIPSPAQPVGGGTIMSYCHLTSVGINFSDGFGIQPGDTIRHLINNTITTTYLPSVMLSRINRTIAANRQCTDPASGITYYWNDNSTASLADDTLALMIKTNGNAIGDLDHSGFAVSSSTIAGYSGGTGDTVHFPTGTHDVMVHSLAMRRYWDVTAITQPTSDVQIMFPFSATDTADVHGSVHNMALPIGSYLMYQTKGSIAPNPAGNFPSATTASFNMYTYAATPTDSNWSLTVSGTTYIANMLTKTLAGGGTGFVTYDLLAVNNVANTGNNVFVYPNPAHDSWFVSVKGINAPNTTLQLFAADGRLVRMQTLIGSLNEINISELANGVYFYRITNNGDVYKGNLVKH